MADLANLDKHFELDLKKYPPRSGAVPTVGDLSAESTDDNGWQLVMPIRHKTDTLDGVTFARTAVEAWQKVLTAWGLI